jgi:hypothetical protein
MQRWGLIAAIGMMTLWSADAAAESTKTNPTPSITHIHRWNWNLRGAVQDYHVLLVTIGSSAHRFGVSKQDDRNHPVSWYGTNYGAIAAVNANFFDFADRAPIGPVQNEGTFWTNAMAGGTTSIAFGGGRAAIFDNAGKLTGPWPTTASFATDGVSGHPWLIRDGRATGPWTEPAGINSRAARTAVGLTGTGLTLIIVVVDAGRAGAQGMTGSDLTLVFSEFAAQQALNLDGTGSSALWIGKEGGLQNKPSDGAERSVANALMILPPAVTPPPDAGADVVATETSTDATDVDTSVVEDTATDDAGSVAPEDPTGDAGEVTDSAVYGGQSGDPGLPSSPAGDASGCACSVPSARAAAPPGGLALAIALALTRRAARNRA